MTRHLQLLLVVAFVATPATIPAQSGSPEASLKLAHKTLVAAINSGNPSMLEPALYRNGVGFFKDSQMIVQLGGGYGASEAIPAVLEDLGRFSMEAYEEVYRVVESTGVVCMATTLEPKKGAKGQPRFIRSTWIYANLNGTWRLVAWHSSDIPLKK